MKTKLISLILIVCTLKAYTQTKINMCGYQGYQTVESAEEFSAICDLYGTVSSGEQYEQALQKVEEILEKVGLFRNFEIEECQGINNALAATIPLSNGNLERYIIYDNSFFNKVTDATGTDWGLISILAHEVGHHLNGHTLKTGGSNHQTELQADEFSGFVLARMGCSLENAQAAISKLLPDQASSTHPAKKDRLTAVERGWNRGNGKIIEVKEIDEEIEIKIIEEKIDDIKIEELITAEQVIAKYIDVIGGQEKIKNIRTLETKVSTKSDMFNNELNFKYLTPTIYTLESRTDTFSSKQLNTNGKIYNKINNVWEELNITVTGQEPIPGYIVELNLLVNNTPLELIGIEKEENESYYVIKVPENKLFAKLEGTESKTIITNYRYYSVRTGLLHKESSVTLTKTKTKIETMTLEHEMESQNTIINKNYKEVNGVLFPFEKKTLFYMEFEGQTTKTEATITFQEIIVNPTFRKEDFIPY
jgi:hypothetical protein